MQARRKARSRVQSRQEVVERLQAALPTLRERYGVRRLALYGSFAEEGPHTRSDVDLVVELERPLGWDFVAMTHFLEQLLGRRVDITTFDASSEPPRRPTNARLWNLFTGVCRMSKNRSELAYLLIY
jgi:predicted nucleotidyltransferase